MHLEMWAEVKVHSYPPPPCISYALVQATVGRRVTEWDALGLEPMAEVSDLDLPGVRGGLWGDARRQFGRVIDVGRRRRFSVQFRRHVI